MTAVSRRVHGCSFTAAARGAAHPTPTYNCWPTPAEEAEARLRVTRCWILVTIFAFFAGLNVAAWGCALIHSLQ